MQIYALKLKIPYQEIFLHSEVELSVEITQKERHF